MYYTIRIFLHEVALHVDHSPEDFKAPYQMGGIRPPCDSEEVPTQALAEAVAECITGAHNLLNTFLSMPVDKARALPVFSYVRISFAAFVLAKLCLSAASPASRIGKVLDRSSLKVESFIDRAILHVRAIVGPVRCRVPAIFLALLFKLRQWCMNPEMIERSEETMNAPALDPGQTATPDEMTEKQASTMKYIQGPGVVEHSSDESSPQTSSDGHRGSFGSIDEFVAHNQSGSEITTQSVLGYNIVTTSVGASNATMEPATTTSIAGFSIPQPTPYLNPNDQMELDQNFFSFFGDMNALSDGGMADLDDWSSLPTDLIGVTDNYNWQNVPANDVPTML